MMQFQTKDIERFLSKINLDDSETCWNWLASYFSNGYSAFWFGENNLPAYRFSYMYFRGEIPKNYEVDHLCRNRKCINPTHLEAVTHWENTDRSTNWVALNRRKENCPKGHPLTPDNLCVSQLARGQRYCKTCRREAAKRYNKKKRGELIHQS